MAISTNTGQLKKGVGEEHHGTTKKAKLRHQMVVEGVSVSAGKKLSQLMKSILAFQEMANVMLSGRRSSHKYSRSFPTPLSVCIILYKGEAL